MSNQKLAEGEILDYGTAIANIARLRDQLSSAERAKKQKEIEFQESYEYRVWEATGVILRAAEKELRMEAVTDFARTDNNKPHPAVQIKMITTFNVSDTQAALDYCINSLPQALSYNAPAFKKLMLAVSEDKRPPCIEIGLKPRADIKTDLSEYAITDADFETIEPEDENGK